MTEKPNARVLTRHEVEAMLSWAESLPSLPENYVRLDQPHDYDENGPFWSIVVSRDEIIAIRALAAFSASVGVTSIHEK